MKNLLFLSSLLISSSFSVAYGAEAVGNYNNGCIMNAVEAKHNAPYYQIYRPQSKRYYGDKTMMDFLDRFSKKAHQIGFESILVGDISSQFGGPMNTGHASHQIGLDVDIEFNTKRLSHNQLVKGGQAQFLVDKGSQSVNSKFNKMYYQLIMAAAHDPEVERIFVGPAIKIAICDMTKDEREQPFLRKIRPWYGHTEHLHVRLRCPKNAPDCEHQAPPEPMHSIAEEKEEALSWFRPAPANADNGPKKPKPPFPKRCVKLYDDLKIKHPK